MRKKTEQMFYAKGDALGKHLEDRFEKNESRLTTLENQIALLGQPIQESDSYSGTQMDSKPIGPKPDDALRTACESLDCYQIEHSDLKEKYPNLFILIQGVKSALAAPEVGEDAPEVLTLGGPWVKNYSAMGGVKFYRNNQNYIWVNKDYIPTLIAWLSAQVPKNGGE